MKLLFISDIHGDYECMRIMLDNINYENPDSIIVLGDVYSHGFNDKEIAEILNGLKNKLLVIRGNCDRQTDEIIGEFKFYDSLTLNYNRKIIFLTHGNIYNMDYLPYLDFDIMIYGHFHEHFIKKQDSKIFASPGSISKPRNNSKHSYMIIEKNKIILKDLNGNLIEQMEF